ncbi:tyrosine phosphatase family protein [Ensifer soli]|uniref:tyrosine phosphatase family protein n=1 Tax=Ciceribacter sp. sgz301302 TaxID=3342379 RepID=UPI0035B77FA9
MPAIVVSPLARIAEMAVRHGCRDMLSLLARGQAFHRPGVIAAARHRVIDVNDMTADAGQADTAAGLILPADHHVAAIIDFARRWDKQAPLLIHCWMGVSRSPAAAVIAGLAVAPETGDAALAAALRRASPHATPNSLMIAIADRLLGRGGALVEAIAAIGRGAEADGDAPFVLPLPPGR